MSILTALSLMEGRSLRLDPCGNRVIMGSHTGAVCGLIIKQAVTSFCGEVVLASLLGLFKARVTRASGKALLGANVSLRKKGVVSLLLGPL